MKDLKKTIARDLLAIKAVFFRPDQPFTWASGIKSPVYCDNRLTLTAPRVRLDVENGLAELIKTHYPDAEVLMGTSTAGVRSSLKQGGRMFFPEERTDYQAHMAFCEYTAPAYIGDESEASLCTNLVCMRKLSSRPDLLTKAQGKHSFWAFLGRFVHEKRDRKAIKSTNEICTRDGGVL